MIHSISNKFNDVDNVPEDFLPVSYTEVVNLRIFDMETAFNAQVQGTSLEKKVSIVS